MLSYHEHFIHYEGPTWAPSLNIIIIIIIIIITIIII